KSPKKDTCSTCDKLKIQLTNTNCSNEQNIILKNQQIQHHNDAEEAFSIKNSAYQLLVWNLLLPSIKGNCGLLILPYMIPGHLLLQIIFGMKHWRKGGPMKSVHRSSLYHYFNNLPSNVSHETMYSDCCPGQNKNGIIMATCLYFLERQENVKIIDHKFMVPGHSRMECDSDHAKIEKAKKRYPFSINHPHYWFKLIQWAGKDKFINTKMKQDQFFDFGNLLKTKYQMKKKNNNGDIFLFRNVKWFRYEKEKKTLVQYKGTLNAEDKFEEINMIRRKVKSDVLPKAYNEILPIADEKKRTFFPFYNSYQNHEVYDH
ncbi:Uncharacterized protein FWK35_00033876, partial [Aphis craccivora]